VGTPEKLKSVWGSVRSDRLPFLELSGQWQATPVGGQSIFTVLVKMILWLPTYFTFFVKWVGNHKTNPIGTVKMP